MPTHEEFEAVYRPMIGRQLARLAWMPLTCDTPDVFRDLGSPELSFSGGVQLIFEPPGEVFLSWRARTPMTLIGWTVEERWGDGVLDRIQVDMESSWASLIRSTLVQVELFTCGERWTDGIVPLNGAAVGARHLFRNEDRVHHFWVGTAFGRNIREADDLWVGLDVEPDNVGELKLIGSVT